MSSYADPVRSAGDNIFFTTPFTGKQWDPGPRSTTTPHRLVRPPTHSERTHRRSHAFAGKYDVRAQYPEQHILRAEQASAASKLRRPSEATRRSLTDLFSRARIGEQDEVLRAVQAGRRIEGGGCLLGWLDRWGVERVEEERNAPPRQKSVEDDDMQDRVQDEDKGDVKQGGILDWLVDYLVCVPEGEDKNRPVGTSPEYSSGNNSSNDRRSAPAHDTCGESSRSVGASAPAPPPPQFRQQLYSNPILRKLAQTLRNPAPISYIIPLFLFLALVSGAASEPLPNHYPSPHAAIPPAPAPASIYTLLKAILTETPSLHPPTIPPTLSSLLKSLSTNTPEAFPPDTPFHLLPTLFPHLLTLLSTFHHSITFLPLLMLILSLLACHYLPIFFVAIYAYLGCWTVLFPPYILVSASRAVFSCALRDFGPVGPGVVLGMLVADGKRVRGAAYGALRIYVRGVILYLRFWVRQWRWLRVKAFPRWVYWGVVWPVEWVVGKGVGSVRVEELWWEEPSLMDMIRERGGGEGRGVGKRGNAIDRGAEEVRGWVVVVGRDVWESAVMCEAFNSVYRLGTWMRVLSVLLFAMGINWAKEKFEV